MRTGSKAASVAAAAVLSAAIVTAAHANYHIRTLTNNTNQIVSISLPVAAGGKGSSTFSSGDMIVAIPGKGIVTFQDMGHNTPCIRPYWGVSIKYKEQQWGFFYDGEGMLDMTIAADGSVTLTALTSPSGQPSVVVTGTGPPTCTQR